MSIVQWILIKQKIESESQSKTINRLWYLTNFQSMHACTRGFLIRFSMDTSLVLNLYCYVSIVHRRMQHCFLSRYLGEPTMGFYFNLCMLMSCFFLVSIVYSLNSSCVLRCTMDHECSSEGKKRNTFKKWLTQFFGVVMMHHRNGGKKLYWEMIKAIIKRTART